MSDHPAVAVLMEMADIIERKAGDYASQTNVFSNFQQVAEATGLSTEQVLHTHIANKTARLNNLLMDGQVPEFESVEDTLLDLANYAALLVAWMRQDKELADSMQVLDSGPLDHYRFAAVELGTE